MITFTRLLKQNPQNTFMYIKKNISLLITYLQIAVVYKNFLELSEGWLLRQFEMQVAFEKRTILVEKYKGRNWFKMYCLFVFIITL